MSETERMKEAAATREYDDETRGKIFDVFGSSPFVQHLGMELIDVRRGEAVLRLVVRDQLRQPYGLMHGGATASLIDTATAFAILGDLGRGEQASTVDLTVQYLRPHTEGAAICTARVVRAGRRLLFVSAEVTDEDGKLIATALSTYAKV